MSARQVWVSTIDKQGMDKYRKKKEKKNCLSYDQINTYYEYLAQ